MKAPSKPPSSTPLDKQPLPQRSLLSTPEGEQALRAEYEYLWRIERPKVTQEVSDAAKLGDRSENAEYIYGKRRLRQIDSRVRFLLKRLEALTVIDRPPADLNRVYFGAWVELEDDDEAIHRYRLVGEDEIDLKHGYISMDAPLARGLAGKYVDDEVIVRLPKGEQTYAILSVTYSRPAWDNKPCEVTHRWLT